MAEKKRGDGGHGESTSRDDNDTYDQFAAHTQS
jgi:hypothetical protein